MKYVKMLGLAAVAALAVMAFLGAGPASATVLCKEAKTSGCTNDYGAGTPIQATQTTGTTAILETTGGTIIVTCTDMALSAKVTATGDSWATVSGPITNFTWGTCTRTTHVLILGGLEVHHIAGTDNGTVTATGGTEVTIATIFGSCVYGFGNGTDIGKITGGNPATLKTEGAVIPKISGNFACPSHGVWWAQFTITSPWPLYISAS